VEVDELVTQTYCKVCMLFALIKEYIRSP